MSTIRTTDGDVLAYAHHQGIRRVGVTYLGGYSSSMETKKATALEAFCIAEGISFTRFDYVGHGKSSGTIQEGSLARWLENALFIVDNVPKEPQILVGSSMGGWLMLHAAQRTTKVCGLLGINIGADFPSILYDRMTPEERKVLDNTGAVHFNCSTEFPDVFLSKALVDESEKFRITNPLHMKCPVMLIHGLQDALIPWTVSLSIQRLISSDTVILSLVKDGDHSFHRPADLSLVLHSLTLLIRNVEELRAV